jgi:hypothetical protein
LILTDWVTITIAASGARVRRRAASIDAYGILPSGQTFIEIGGRAISVRETVDEIAQKLQDTEGLAYAPRSPRYSI